MLLLRSAGPKEAVLLRDTPHSSWPDSPAVGNQGGERDWVTQLAENESIAEPVATGKLVRDSLQAVSSCTRPGLSKRTFVALSQLLLCQCFCSVNQC